MVGVMEVWAIGALAWLAALKQTLLGELIIGFMMVGGIGGVLISALLDAFSEASWRKLRIAGLWSLIGISSYVLLVIGCVGGTLIVLSRLGLGGELTASSSLGVGGVIAWYVWYRFNWWAFRALKDRLKEKRSKEGEKEESQKDKAERGPGKNKEVSSKTVEA
jgi:hypothetical protein